MRRCVPLPTTIDQSTADPGLDFLLQLLLSDSYLPGTPLNRRLTGSQVLTQGSRSSRPGTLATRCSNHQEAGRVGHARLRLGRRHNPAAGEYACLQLSTPS